MSERSQYAPSNTVSTASVTELCGSTQPDAADGVNRCARGGRCEDRRTYHNPDTGDRYTLAATVDGERQLCPTDVRHLGYTLGALPLDIAELTVLLRPSTQVKLRPVGMPTAPRIKLHAPVPINLDAEGLRALIGHECSDMAAALAALLEPDDEAQRFGTADRARVDTYVPAAAAYLHEHLAALLALPEQAWPAWSAGIDPSAGHPDNAATGQGDDGRWWIWRDGAALALRVFDLHRRVEKFTGRAPADRIPVPCPECGTPAVVREHRNRQVVCRRCWTQWTDDQWDQNVGERLVGLFGLAA